MHDRSENGINDPPENLRPEEEPPKVNGSIELDTEGFIFMDAVTRAFKCRLWHRKPWLFRWCKNDKCWIPVREISQGEIDGYYKVFNAGALAVLKEILEQEK